MEIFAYFEASLRLRSASLVTLSFFCQIYCLDDDRTHNCSVATDDATSSVHIQDVDPERTYRIRLAARTSRGVGVWSKTFVVGQWEKLVVGFAFVSL